MRNYLSHYGIHGKICIELRTIAAYVCDKVWNTSDDNFSENKINGNCTKTRIF